MSNPAERLRFILSSCVSQPSKIAHGTMLSGWAKILEVNPEDSFSVLSKLGKVATLPGIAYDMLRDHPDKNSLFLWQTGLAEVFSRISFGDTMFQTFTQKITPSILGGIDLCAKEIRRKYPREKELSESHIELTRERTTELFDHILLDDEDSELKRFILHHLNLILQALDDYQIFGVSPLMDAVDAAYGAAMVSNNTEFKRKLDACANGRKLWDLLGKTLLVLELANNTAQLIGWQQVCSLNQSEMITKALPGRTL